MEAIKRNRMKIREKRVTNLRPGAWCNRLHPIAAVMVDVFYMRGGIFDDVNHGFGIFTLIADHAIR